MNGRWWEYYAVRYLVGSIVGAVAILYLGKYSGSQFSKSEHIQPLLDPLLQESNYFLSAIALAALGFAFCYIASSPILVFHTCRACFRSPTLRKYWKRFSIACWIVVVVVVAVIIMAGSIISGCSKHFPLLTILLLAIFISQIALLIIACNDRFKTIKTFYEDLAKKRARPAKSKRNKTESDTREKLLQTEYTTSYRHLREHGNAMGIIVLEIILAFALANLPSISCAVVFLVLWILPGVFAWIIGTALEFNFVDRFPFR